MEKGRTERGKRNRLVKGLVGILPIPVIGEIGLSMFFYDVLDRAESSRFKHAAIPAALLTRFVLYGGMYSSMYEGLRNFLA